MIIRLKVFCYFYLVRAIIVTILGYGSWTPGTGLCLRIGRHDVVILDGLWVHYNNDSCLIDLLHTAKSQLII